MLTAVVFFRMDLIQWVRFFLRVKIQNGYVVLRCFVLRYVNYKMTTSATIHTVGEISPLWTQPMSKDTSVFLSTRQVKVFYKSSKLALHLHQLIQF